jgi:hypothetical protein
MDLDSVQDWDTIGKVLDEIVLRCEEIEKWGFKTWYTIDPDGLPHIHVESIGGKL